MEGFLHGQSVPTPEWYYTVMAGTLPRLLALDIDGTITTPQHTVSDRTVRAIRRATEAGIIVVLATGRRYRDSLSIAATLGISHPLITSAGALIKEPRTHATRFCARFAGGVLEGVLNLIDSTGHEAIVYTDSFHKGFDFHCRGLDVGSAGLRSYLDRNRSLAHISPELHQRPPTGSFAAFSMGPEAAMLKLEHEIRTCLGSATSVHVIRSPRYCGYLCEIAPAGVTKWSGIEQVAASLQIPQERICAVGDDVNDIPMLQAAGLGVAMGNADQRVRDVADQTTGPNDADGLADLIDRLLAGSVAM
jgi:Cof subfamily protein (haloacid dehalogenase superfamily)